METPPVYIGRPRERPEGGAHRRGGRGHAGVHRQRHRLPGEDQAHEPVPRGRLTPWTAGTIT